MASALDAALARRSASKVTDAAPDDAELLSLLEGAAHVADHASLRPWRAIALRGRARDRLGEALTAAATASGADAAAAAKLASKPLRAPLLVAIAAVVTPGHPKVPEWEQEASAAGVAHVLSLLLDEAGWGVMWRTGPYTRHPLVTGMLGLGEHERLLGWLYVGGRPPRTHDRAARRGERLAPSRLTVLG